MKSRQKNPFKQFISLAYASQDLSRLVVQVKWKGSNKSNNPLTFMWGNVRRNVTNKGSLKDDGVVEWNEEFVIVCNFLGFKDGCFHQWKVAFMVLNESPRPINIIIYFFKFYFI